MHGDGLEEGAVACGHAVAGGQCVVFGQGRVVAVEAVQELVVSQ